MVEPGSACCSGRTTAGVTFLARPLISAAIAVAMRAGLLARTRGNRTAGVSALARRRGPPHARPMPAVHGYHHLAIQGKDLAAVERFYVDALGLKVVKRWPREEGPGDRSLWLSVGVPSGAPDAAGEWQGDTGFLALEACDAERPPTAFRDPHGGLHLLALPILASEREAWEPKPATLGPQVEHRKSWTPYLGGPQ